MRLFAAVRPPDDVLAHLEGALASVRGDRGGVGDPSGRGPLRWTVPDDRHVTVAFYGTVPDGYLDEMARGLAGVAAGIEPFDAALSGAGLFDGRTLWVGCTGDGWAPLMSEAGDLAATLLGRPVDRRSRPHLTIARSRSGAGRGVRGGDGRRRAPGRGSGPAGRGDGRAGEPGPAALAHALALYRGPSWRVADVVLFSSHLGAGRGGRPRYEVVHVAPLGAVAG